MDYMDECRGVLSELIERDGLRRDLGEALGLGALKQPGRGAPVTFGGLVHGVERAELAVALGATELLTELSIAAGFAAEGAESAANVASGAFESAAGGDEGADFSAFRVVEGARTAGRLRRGVRGWGL